MRSLQWVLDRTCALVAPCREARAGVTLHVLTSTACCTGGERQATAPEALVVAVRVLWAVDEGAGLGAREWGHTLVLGAARSDAGDGAAVTALACTLPCRSDTDVWLRALGTGI